MKYANYNKETGQLLGWYDKDIHEAIPQPSLEVSDEVWNEAITVNANYVDSATGKLSVKDFRTQAEIEAQAKAQAVQDAKDYLAKTDHKMLPNYEPKQGEDLDAIIVLRAEARVLVRG